MEHKTKNKTRIVIRGFTLIEIVVVIALAVLLVYFTTQMFGSFRNSQVLQGETSQALSIINKAQSHTLNSKADSEYGVRVNADQLILFSGLSFSSSSPTNEAYVLHSTVGISSTTFSGGGTDIVFDRLTGDTSNNGSFTVYLKNDPTQKNVISISKTGATAQN
jgi:prepilin-type N-terminal cleavage/methylation domain-containing protein